jgi:hypothetical protein
VHNLGQYRPASGGLNMHGCLKVSKADNRAVKGIFSPSDIQAPNGTTKLGYKVALSVAPFMTMREKICSSETGCLRSSSNESGGEVTIYRGYLLSCRDHLFPY